MMDKDISQNRQFGLFRGDFALVGSKRCAETLQCRCGIEFVDLPLHLLRYKLSLEVWDTKRQLGSYNKAHCSLQCSCLPVSAWPAGSVASCFVRTGKSMVDGAGAAAPSTTTGVSPVSAAMARMRERVVFSCSVGFGVN